MRFAALLLAVLLAFPALPLDFGAPFPLTNTRYGSAFAVPELVWTGQNLFLFWAAPNHVRMTRVTGERRAGVPVFATYALGTELDGNMPWRSGIYTTRNFDVVWTGSHFVLVAAPRWGMLAAQAIGVNGEPLRPPVILATEGAWRPQIAFNGEVVLLLYGGPANEVRAAVLTKDGTPISNGELIASRATDFGLASNGSTFAAGVVEIGSKTHFKQFGSTGQLLSSTYVSDAGLSAIAANAEGWLLTSGATALFIDRNGNARPELRVDPSIVPIYSPAAAWNGAEWVITYGTYRFGTTGYEFHVATVDERAARVTARHLPFPGRSVGLTAASDDRTYISWWPAEQNPPPAPLFGEMPVLTSGAELTFKASEQKHLASVSTNAATLVVWSEESNNEITVHAGVRTRSGGWSERVLGNGMMEMTAVAATDGTNFLVVTQDDDGSIAYRLDGGGTPLAEPLKLPFAVDSAASNGRVYALVGSDNRGVVLTSSGQLGTPVTIATRTKTFRPFRPSVASDGSEFFVAWIINPDCMFLPCSGGTGIGGVWLTRDLQRRDEKNLILDFDEQGIFNRPSVVWNGSEYVVVWDSLDGVEAATVPRLAGTPSLPFVVEKAMALWPDRLRVTRDDVVILSGNSKLSFAATLLDRNRTLTRLGTFDFSSSAMRGWPTLEVLPDGRFALLTSPVVEPAPQRGTTHVMMAIEDAVRLSGAPQLTATADRRDVHLSWTAPSDSVNGYRIEYRIGDGSWNEIAQWFTVEQRSATFRLPRTGARAVFRIRAFSDGGAGAYSHEAAVNATRRRAVK